MANNKNINQVIYGTSTLIDLTNDTVTPERMYKGIKAHMADGSTTTGTAEVTVENTRLIMPEGFIGLVSSTSDEHTPIPEAIVVSKTVTHNGTYYAASDNADGYNPIVVNVSGGGGTGLVYESGTYTPASDISRPTIAFTNSHTTRPFYVYIADNSSGDVSQNSLIYWFISNFYDIFGKAWAYYGRVQRSYSNGNAETASGTTLTSETGTNNTAIEYYLTTSNFQPYTGSSTRYFRSARTYKWIAVWAPSS